VLQDSFPSSGACDCAVELPHGSFCSVKTEDLALVSSLASSTFVASHKHIPRSVSGPLEHDSTAKMRQCE